MSKEKEKERTLVDEVMQEMEKGNGSYNEDTGDFPERKQLPNVDPRQTNERQQLIAIINGNEQLRQLIGSNPRYQQTMNSILSHDELIKDLMNNNQELIPDFIQHILLNENNPHDDLDAKKQNPNPSEREPGVRMPDAKFQHPMEDEGDRERVPELGSGPEPAIPMELRHRSEPNSEVQGEGSREFNWLNLFLRPVIAIICYFIVNNTPLLFYLGQIPYVGNLLIANKMLTSMVMVGLLFMIMDVLVDFSGITRGGRDTGVQH